MIEILQKLKVKLEEQANCMDTTEHHDVLMGVVFAIDNTINELESENEVKLCISPVCRGKIKGISKQITLGLEPIEYIGICEKCGARYWWQPEKIKED